ncbi:MAG: hypothetical protein ACXW2E_12665 [Nitrososphaeraceae archaeon]
MDSNRSLHEYIAMDLPYNRKIRNACGLSRMTPSRRTFNRRLTTISRDIKNRITTLMNFLYMIIVDPILSANSTLVKVKCFGWNKSSMKKKVIPYSGIDTDAIWGSSHTKGLSELQTSWYSIFR